MYVAAAGGVLRVVCGEDTRRVERERASDVSRAWVEQRVRVAARCCEGGGARGRQSMHASRRMAWRKGKCLGEVFEVLLLLSRLLTEPGGRATVNRGRTTGARAEISVAYFCSSRKRHAAGAGHIHDGNGPRVQKGAKGVAAGAFGDVSILRSTTKRAWSAGRVSDKTQ